MFNGIHLCYCYPWQPMLYSHEKWCHLSQQSFQTVPDIMSPFQKNRTKGLKMRAIKAQTDDRKDVLLATSAKLKTVKNWTDGSGQEPHLFPLQRWHSWHCYRSCCCLYHPMKTKTKCTYWWLHGQEPDSESVAEAEPLLHEMRVEHVGSDTVTEKQSSQGLIHTVNLNCSKHVCVCMRVCTNWENECHQPFYSRQKLDSFPISNQRANNLVPRHQLFKVRKHDILLYCELSV